MPISLRRPLLDTSKKYLLRDTFAGDAAAGTLNGTPASGGPGTRTVTDTENKLSVVGGVLSFAGGMASPAWGDPGLWYGAVSRAAGRMLLVDFNTSSGAMEFGFGDIQSGEPVVLLLKSVSLSLYAYANNFVVGDAVGSYGEATDYQCAFSLRATGGYVFIKGGNYINWTLLFPFASGTIATLYPAIANYNGAFTVANIRIPTQLWLPSPLASDGFSSAATDGLGHAEQNGGNGLAWTGATWTVAAGAVTNTPTVGADVVVNGSMETGDPPSNWIVERQCTLSSIADERTGGSGLKSIAITMTDSFPLVRQTVSLATSWAKLSAWGKNVDADYFSILVARPDYSGNDFGTPDIAPTIWTQYVSTGRVSQANPFVFLSSYSPVAASSFRVDDVMLEPLSLSTLFRSLSISTPDVLADVAVTLTAGTQAGLVLNLDDAATPANFVIAYHNGTNCLLEKCVAGVYTTVISAAATYSAGAVLRVSKDGTAYRLYYNNALVGTGTISDAGIVSNLSHGLFSTYSGNSFDNLTIWARGTGNEYSALDTF